MSESYNLPDSWHQHQAFMRKALDEAKLAYEKEEVPVGAVVVHEGRIIGRGHNMVETLKDPTAHAEMIAISSACGTLDQKFLSECSLYVTLEPCPMCSGAVVWSRMKTMYIGALDPKAGGSGSVFNISSNRNLNYQVEIVHSILEEECSELLKRFFNRRR
ncbi:MAG: tRNA adenosine(34) deaminase TadA [Balneolia bacterium]|nr:tRNA adenosine(34) deaminase TadA [Balneolia bacterium]